MSNNSLIVTNMKSFRYLCCLVALVEIQVNCWSIDLTCTVSGAKSFHNRVLYKIPNNLLAICHYSPVFIKPVHNSTLVFVTMFMNNVSLHIETS